LPEREVLVMLVEPVDLQSLLVPAVWQELAALAVAWLCVAGACAATSLLIAGRLGWFRRMGSFAEPDHGPAGTGSGGRRRRPMSAG
jgi:hypothetical protein